MSERMREGCRKAMCERMREGCRKAMGERMREGCRKAMSERMREGCRKAMSAECRVSGSVSKGSGGHDVAIGSRVWWGSGGLVTSQARL